MARSKITITTSWVNIFTGPGVITVEKLGSGVLLFNNAASDTEPLSLPADVQVGEQVDQRAAVDTYAKATGTGWEVIVDTDA